MDAERASPWFQKVQEDFVLAFSQRGTEPNTQEKLSNAVFPFETPVLQYMPSLTQSVKSLQVMLYFTKKIATTTNGDRLYWPKWVTAETRTITQKSKIVHFQKVCEGILLPINASENSMNVNVNLKKVACSN